MAAAQLPASGCDKLKDSLAIGDCLARKAEEKFHDSYRWQVGTDASKLTDQKGVYLTALSQNEIKCRWKSETRAILTIRCQENTTAMMLSIDGCQLVSNVSDYGTVTYRLDKQGPRSVAMEASADEEALGPWKGRKSIPIIKTMFGKSQLINKPELPFGTPFSGSMLLARIR